MPADQQRLLGFATQRRPEIARFVAMRLGRDLRELVLQPGARLRPLLREGHPLRSISIGSQRVKFLQLCDGAFWVERGFRVRLQKHAILQQAVCPARGNFYLPNASLPVD